MYVGSCLLLVAKAVADLLVKLRSLGPEPLLVRCDWVSTKSTTSQKKEAFNNLILVITVCDTLFSISKKRNNNSRTKKRRQGMEVVCEGEMTGLVEE